ncbi:MAG: hypothetical protein COA41_11145 [Sphingopyxis sp.]|nr:MAG: hypothetical protein COA41_11145 [Sphingopyxis sp.]
MPRFTKQVSQESDICINAEVFDRYGKSVSSNYFLLGSQKWRFKRAHAWADKQIANCEKYTVYVDAAGVCPGPDVFVLLSALDEIGGLSRALRVGGPDPMDLQGLSDALREAVDVAHEALAAFHQEDQ